MKEKILRLLEKKANNEDQIYQYLELNPNPKITTETSLDNSDEAYADGSTGPAALFTSFSDYYKIFQDIQERGILSFCDIGGGIGKGKILFDLFDESQSLKTYSFELLEQRHREGLRVHSNLKLDFPEGFQCCDLKKTEIPHVDSYFLYLPVGPVLDHVISQLELIVEKKSSILYVIESHGDLISYLRSVLPLKLLTKTPLTSQRHNPDLHIFKIGPLQEWLKAKLQLFKQNEEALVSHSGLDFTYYSPVDILYTLKQLEATQGLQLIIKDQGKKWLASLKGWKFGIVVGTIEIQSPYRIVQFSQLEAIVSPPEDWKILIRKREEVFKPPLSSLRKLFIQPQCAIEYASGEIEQLNLNWPFHNFPKLQSRLILDAVE